LFVRDVAVKGLRVLNVGVRTPRHGTRSAYRKTPSGTQAMFYVLTTDFSRRMRTAVQQAQRMPTKPRNTWGICRRLSSILRRNRRRFVALSTKPSRRDVTVRVGVELAQNKGADRYPEPLLRGKSARSKPRFLTPLTFLTPLSVATLNNSQQISLSQAQPASTTRTTLQRQISVRGVGAWRWTDGDPVPCTGYSGYLHNSIVLVVGAGAADAAANCKTGHPQEERRENQRLGR